METIKVLSQAEQLPFLLNFIQESYKKQITNKDYFTMALSGGNTPFILYKELATASFIDWSKFYFFLVDERFTSLDSTDSNYNNIKRVLFSKAPIPKENIFYFNTELDDITTCKKQYQTSIVEFFKAKDIHKPQLDLTLLGMGDDGHTASIFPGDALINQKECLVVSTTKSYLGYRRLSLTIEFINQSRQILFLINGENKKEKVAQVMQKRNMNLPAAHVRGNNVTYLLDKNAAQLLQT